MLILFDIDGTLLVTKRAGINAMLDAGRALYGDAFTTDGISFSGRLDALIWRDLAKLNRLDAGDEHHHRFRTTYGEKLTERLERERTAKLLPGVRELVAALQKNDAVTIGLLTGNYPETGRLKIRHAGLDPDVFLVAAWGCDAPSRRDLTPLAMSRYRVQFGRILQGDEVVIIGDTPHDIDCASAHGCRSIGVATGEFSVIDLENAGADLALATLADTDAVMEWIVESALPASE